MAMSLYVLLVFGSGAMLAEGQGMYWGTCDRWNRERNSCTITSGEKCWSNLSPGPENATFELVLGNLPPSTPERPVHVHFFAAREALGYNPLDGPHLHTIYRVPRAAYPLYTDPDFNGGNVRVNESGHAVMRFKAPSTYVVYRTPTRMIVRWPHIKTRLCTGDNFADYRVEAIDFTWDGVRVRASSANGTYKVHGFKRTNVPIPQWPNATTPAVAALPETTTKMAATTTTTEKATTTLAYSTTTTFMTSTTERVIADVTVSDHPDTDDSYDWDALEYSPVYLCLLDDLVYNHFMSDCSETCPSDSDLKHGQCVRQSQLEQEVEFSMSWELKVDCDEECWNSKKSRSLHMLRLAVADHLDIPFQEVLKVVLRPEVHPHTHRRLSNHYGGASLVVNVTSGRIDAKKGEELLRTFLGDSTSASVILGMEVSSVLVDKKVTTVDAIDDAEASDEYSQFYKEHEPEDQSGTGFSTIPGSPSDVFPAGVVVGVAAGVVVLGMLTAAFMWYRKRMQQPNVQGKDVEKAVKVGAGEEESKIPEANKVDVAPSGTNVSV